MSVLKLHNTLTRKKEDFVPIDNDHVRVYACGPTVYGRIHVGNARPIVVFDVLVRLLRLRHAKVTYVRNITDVDDKINIRAAERGIGIDELCADTIETFHQDTERLGALAPDIEPRATHHIAEMQAMITTLIDKGHAYAADGHVLFQVSTMADYGSLSKRSMDDMIAGARVEIAPYKREPADFILWKPSSDDQPGWDSPWGRGRPGWHIECSAMAKTYLGEVFDIHAGGLDLIFPHHENEIAQSCCAHDRTKMANFWIHNGYVNSDGEKMSKSLGNFITINDLLSEFSGETIRYVLMQAHYRAPLNFSKKSLVEAKKSLSRLYRAVDGYQVNNETDHETISNLYDDLNTPKALARAHYLADQANKGSKECAQLLKNFSKMLGILSYSSEDWFKSRNNSQNTKKLNNKISEKEINKLILERQNAKQERNFKKADEIREKLLNLEIILEDQPGKTTWRKV